MRNNEFTYHGLGDAFYLVIWLTLLTLDLGKVYYVYLPQDMAFRSQMVPYPLFTIKFNGDGGTVYYHLTIKYIQHFIQF